MRHKRRGDRGDESPVTISHHECCSSLLCGLVVTCLLVTITGLCEKAFTAEFSAQFSDRFSVLIGFSRGPRMRPLTNRAAAAPGHRTEAEASGLI